MTRTVNPKFFEYLKTKEKCSAGTHESYEREINKFLAFVDKPEEEITSFDITAWVNSFPKYASATVARKIATIKSYFKFLGRFDLVDVNPTTKIEAPRVKNRPKHYMSAEMIRDMINSCNTSRDRAIVYVYATTGMRVSELTHVTINQYNEMKENNDNMIEIVGKGNKARFVVFNEEAQRLIDDYIKTRAINGVHSDSLFLSFQGNEIARNNLNNTLKSIAKRAGIPFWNEISNHQLRSACASIYSEAGVPVATIRDILGHNSIETTNRYIKTSTEQIQRATMTIGI